MWWGLPITVKVRGTVSYHCGFLQHAYLYPGQDGSREVCYEELPSSRRGGNGRILHGLMWLEM